jgi:mono/diheme cytochrome c family protein
MRKLWALVFLLAGCVDQSKLAPEVRGEGAFKAYNCQRCHRVGPVGGDTGPDLTFVGFRKSADFLALWLKDPAAWEPRTLMPNFQMSERGRLDIAAYLATLRGAGFSPSEPAPWQSAKAQADPLVKGALLYKHVGCVTCHGREGTGGYANNNVPGGKIPNLKKVAQTYSREELVEKIKIGVRHPAKADAAGPEPHLWMPAWGEVLSKDEIDALAQTLLSWSKASGENPAEEW